VLGVHVNIDEAGAQRAGQVGAFLERVLRREVHDEPAADPGHVHQHVLLGVLDHAPGVAVVGRAVDHLDVDAGLGELIGKRLQARALSGRPVARVPHAGHEG
jgi:hypothetical protein